MPAQGEHRPGLAPGGTVSLDRAVEECRPPLMAAPSAASTIGTPMVQCRSSPSRRRCRAAHDLDVEVAGRTPPTDLALGGRPDPHPVADTGGDLDTDLAPERTRPSPHSGGGRGSEMTSPTPRQVTGRAVMTPTEQRALHGLHLAALAAGVARHRPRIAVGALALAAIAQYGGVDGDLFG